MSDDATLTLDELRDRVDSIRTVMLTTIDEAGTLSSRPLTVADVDDEGHVVFVVGKDADWVVAGVSAANVAFVDDRTWVSVAGRLTFSDHGDLLDELWNPMVANFFPDGKESATVAHLASDRWEYWTAPNRVAQVYEMVKGKVTGEMPDLGESGTIET